MLNAYLASYQNSLTLWRNSKFPAFSLILRNNFSPITCVVVCLPRPMEGMGWLKFSDLFTELIVPQQATGVVGTPYTLWTTLNTEHEMTSDLEIPPRPPCNCWTTRSTNIGDSYWRRWTTSQILPNCGELSRQYTVNHRPRLRTKSWYLTTLKYLPQSRLPTISTDSSPH